MQLKTWSGIKPGDKFGMLTVQELTTQKTASGYERTAAVCRCDCGAVLTVYTADLKAQRRSSCSKCNKKFREERGLFKFQKFVGEKFGQATVINFFHAKDSTGKKYLKVTCACSCGRLYSTTWQYAKSGNSCCQRCSEKKSAESAHTRYIEVTGKKYNRVTVLGVGPTEEHGEPTVYCLCDCGNYFMTRRDYVMSGFRKSCGCLVGEDKITHNLSKNRLFGIWANMKDRCYRVTDDNSNGYRRYGGRGIKVCDEWLHDFVAFYNWSMTNGYKKGLQIDRIDNDGNYSPQNCRWTTRKENMRNRSCTIFLTVDGVKKAATEWAELTGVKRGRLVNKIKKSPALAAGLVKEVLDDNLF